MAGKRTTTSYTCLLIVLIAFCLGLSLPARAASANDSDQLQPSAAPQTTFKDISSNENLLFINYLATRKIMNGFPDGSFAPEKGISRGQMASIIAVIKQLPLVIGYEGGDYTDVPTDCWAAGSIKAVSQAGYMEGFPDGSFRPDEELSRAQGMAAILRLVSPAPTQIELPVIKDLETNHWAAGAIASALAAGMIGLADDGSFLPDKVLTRGELARSLVILLTRHPDLYPSPLNGKIIPGGEEVKVLRQGQEIAAEAGSDIREGDLVQTGASTAELSFPDGSSILVKENTVISIEKSAGRSYIRNDGSPGTGVEDLNIKLQQGMVFGALASLGDARGDQQNAAASARVKNGNYMWLASLRGIYGWVDVAGGNKGAVSASWWETSSQKRVKMKIDMPWGVMGIRGTFVKIDVAADGKAFLACLTGEAEVSNGGGAVELIAGQASSMSSPVSPPAEPTPLSDDDKADFAGVQEWIIRTALQMTSQQEAVIAPPGAESEAAEQPVSILDKVTQSLQDSGIELQESLLQTVTGEEEKTPDYEDVETDKKWTLVFNEDIDPATIPGNICVSRDSLGIFKVPISSEIDPKYQSMITVKPQSSWMAGQTYYLIVSDGLKSQNGNSLGEDSSIMFTTASVQTPLGDFLQQAQALLNEGKIREAIELATTAIQQAPDDFRAYLLRAQAYLNFDRESAASDLDQAANLNPFAPEIQTIQDLLDWSAETEDGGEEDEPKPLKLYQAY